MLQSSTEVGRRGRIRETEKTTVGHKESRLRERIQMEKGVRADGVSPLKRRLRFVYYLCSKRESWTSDPKWSIVFPC